VRTASEILQAPDTFASTALALLVDEFGTECLEWDPATLELEIRDLYRFQPDTELLDMVNAAASLHASNLFQLSLETFAAICNALNRNVVTSEMFLPPDLDDVLWGVTEAKILLGDIYDETKFSHNISRFVGALLSSEGVRKPPALLAFAEYPEDFSENEDALADDPEAFELYWQSQSGDMEEMEAANAAKIRMLFKQLADTPLKNGSTKFADQA